MSLVGRPIPEQRAENLGSDWSLVCIVYSLWGNFQESFPYIATLQLCILSELLSLLYSIIREALGVDPDPVLRGRVTY